MNRETYNTPESPLAKPREFFVETFNDLDKATLIGWQLFRQNLASRYRNSFLGYLWSFIPPVILMLTAYMMHNAKIIPYSNSEVPYPVFVLSGTIIWQLFSESLQGMINLIHTKRTLLTRLSFPRESLIIAQLLESHLNLIILAIPLAVLASIYGVDLSVISLLAILFLSTTIVLGTLIGAMLAPLTLLVEDIKRLTSIFLTFFFLITPIAYQAPTESILGDLILLNPLSGLVNTIRELLFASSNGLTSAPFIIALSSLLLLIFAWLGFRISAPIALERVGTL